jgi:hypothetical protein
MIDTIIYDNIIDGAATLGSNELSFDDNDD